MMSENIDELKKKVLELCDTIDKQNDYIKKYQRALEIASVDGVCPFCDTSKEREKCRIYKVRPNICRRFICSETRGHRMGCAERHIINMWDEFYVR